MLVFKEYINFYATCSIKTKKSDTYIPDFFLTTQSSFSSSSAYQP